MTTAVIQVVSSVYALEHYLQPKDGMLFKTLGRLSPFDGQAAEYMYKENNTSVIDNIDVVGHSSNNGRFIVFKEKNAIITDEQRIELEGLVQQAETARDAAQVGSGIYTTAAAGISATTNGQYFSVPVVGTNDYLILYKNNSGTALEINRYPSKAAVTRPTWAGKTNAYPDPFFRKISLTTRNLLNAVRWWVNIQLNPFAGWSLVNNAVFDGKALRRQADYGLTTISSPVIILSEIGAIAGDTITVYGLFVGDGAVVFFPARFDNGTDAGYVSAQLNAENITAVGTSITVSATPQWMRHSVVVPENATRMVFYPYTNTAAKTFDWVALWGGKGNTSHVPDYPNFGSNEALAIENEILKAEITDKDRTAPVDYALLTVGKVSYASATKQLAVTSVAINSSYSNPFTGWGERFTPIGISFNAFTIKSMSRKASATTVKWRKINIVVRTGENSHQAGSTVVAVGSILVNTNADTLSDITILLKDPVTDEIKTLTDADFSGGEYFIGIYATDKNDVAAGMSTPQATQSNTLGQSYYLTTANAKTGLWSTNIGNLRVGVEHLLLISPTDDTSYEPTTDFLEKISLGTVSPITNPIVIAAPPTLHVLQGREVSLYFDALFYGKADDYLLDVTGASTGKQQAERYTTNPSGTVTSHNVTINAYDKDTNALLASAITRVVGVTSSANTGTTKKVLMVGDSLTQAGIITQTLLDIAATDVMGVTLIGTRGTGLNLHEGRGGWKVSDYATVGRTFYSFSVSGVTTPPQINSTQYSNNGSTFTVQEVAISSGSGTIICERTSGTNTPSASGILTKANAGVGDSTLTYSVTAQVSGNPFWISSAVNVPQYLTNNSLDAPDVVIIMLGVNDTFNDTSDLAAASTADASLTLLDALITSIKEINDSVKIALIAPTCPSSSQDAFSTSYGAGQTQWRAKRNMVIYAKALYEKYKDKEDDRIYICAANVNLDTVNNMPVAASELVNSRSTVSVVRQNNGVHPATSGYQQIGDAVWAFLKNI